MRYDSTEFYLHAIVLLSDSQSLSLGCVGGTAVDITAHPVITVMNRLLQSDGHA